VSGLADREAIRDLVVRYNSYGDAGRFGPLLALFADDAVMELEDRVYRGITEITTIFTGTQQRLRDRDVPGYVRHFAATHQVDLFDEEHATGRLYFEVLSPVGLDHWGRYVDRYRRVDGNWRFAHRVVHVDGKSANSLFAS